jgi:transcriptional regulator with XRE-family HTH domain
MKLTQQDMARILGITTATLRNWRKDKPNLYQIVIQSFAVEDVKKTLRDSLEKLESVGEVAKKK